MAVVRKLIYLIVLIFLFHNVSYANENNNCDTVGTQSENYDHLCEAFLNLSKSDHFEIVDSHNTKLSKQQILNLIILRDTILVHPGATKEEVYEVSVYEIACIDISKIIICHDNVHCDSKIGALVQIRDEDGNPLWEEFLFWIIL